MLKYLADVLWDEIFFSLEDTDYASLTSEPLLKLAQVLTKC